MALPIAQQTSYGLVESDFLREWYPKAGVPIDLKRAIDGLDPFELGTIPTLDEQFYTERLIAKQTACKGTHRPCHDEQHACRTCIRAKEVLEALQELLGKAMFEQIFPRGLIQAIMLALASHDRGHPGANWTRNALPELLPPMPRGLPGTHKDYSLELLTSWWNDEDDERDNIPVKFRIIAVLMTWASSNGGHTELGKQLEVNTVRPQSLLSWLMRAVDITFSDDFVLNTHFETQLMWVESLGFRPETLRELIKHRAAFLRHVEYTYGEFDKATNRLLEMTGVPYATQGFSITSLLGWRRNVERTWRRLQQLEDDDPEMLAVTLTALAVNGAKITF